MEYSYSNNIITMPNKDLTTLDHFVIKFLKAVTFKYVIISGYLSILFGRSRNTEDVDIFIERISAEKFYTFCKKLDMLGFYILDAEDLKDAYERLNEGLSVRFAETDTTEPNFELKFPKRDTDYYSMSYPVKTVVNGKHEIFISPIELQIAYKLYLGSEKDELDARHLYGIFKDDMDKKKLKEFITVLNVKHEYVKEVLGEKID